VLHLRRKALLGHGRSLAGPRVSRFGLSTSSADFREAVVYWPHKQSAGLVLTDNERCLKRKMRCCAVALGVPSPLECWVGSSSSPHLRTAGI